MTASSPDSRSAVTHGPADAWLSAPRTTRLAVAILLGLGLGFAVFVGTSRDLRTLNGGRLGGDYPAFYAAGRMLNAGHPEQIYSVPAQEKAQQDLFPPTQQGWLLFPYPPHFAVFYQPFALLPFVSSYVVYTLLMAACCALAIRLVAPAAPWCQRNQTFWVAMALIFYPLFRAVTGGQNTALSLLCAAGTAASLRTGRHHLAGVCLAAWLFKPQLALLATALLIVGGHAAVLPAFAAAAGVVYAVGAVVGGLAWPLWWYQDGIKGYMPANMAIDGERGLSLRELTTTLGHPELFVPALALLAIVACIVIHRFKPPALSLVSGATAVALLASPHTMYYDGGLALLGIVAISRGRLTLVVGFLAAGLLFVPAPVSPLVLGSLFLCGLGLACLTDLPSEKTAEPAFPSSLPLFPDEVRGS